MYNETIQALLASCFERKTNSLTFDRAFVNSSKTYYYTISENDVNSILAIRDALNLGLPKGAIGSFNELRQEKFSFSNELQCACYYEENGIWHLEFYRIEGVKYHRSYGKRVAATMILSKHPFAALSEEKKELLYGTWGITSDGEWGRKTQNTEGMCFWTNINCVKSSQYRKFVVGFLSEIANKEKKYILKDVASAVEKHGFFLPMVNCEKLISYHTPADMIRSFMREQDNLHINLNRLDLNTGLVAAILCRYIDMRDMHFILNMSTNTMAECMPHRSFCDGFANEQVIELFIAAFYCKSETKDYRSVAFWERAKDYVRLCINTNTPIRLRYDYSEVSREHNRMVEIENKKVNAEEFAKPLIAVPSKFDALELAITEICPDEFVRIKSTHDLYDEGLRQHNCVYSRRNEVREDSASIYHWKHNDVDYTVQFETDFRTGNYCVAEIRGNLNKECPKETRKELEEILQHAQELMPVV